MMMDDDECAAIGEMLGRGNRFVHHKSHMNWPRLKPQWEASY
jgi:hypothetical protein